jgi:hypothetical protein
LIKQYAAARMQEYRHEPAVQLPRQISGSRAVTVEHAKQRARGRQWLLRRWDALTARVRAPLLERGRDSCLHMAAALDRRFYYVAAVVILLDSLVAGLPRPSDDVLGYAACSTRRGNLFEAAA